MTVSTNASQVVLKGNGITTVFSFPFIGVTASDLQVIYTNSTGQQTTLTSSQYLVALNLPSPGQLWGVGGTITYPLSGSPIANTTTVTITRVVPLTQQVSISNQGDFYPSAVERAIDLLCMEIQQVSGRTGQLRGTWVSGVLYNFGDIVVDGVNGSVTNNLYVCQIANTSSVWSTDLAAGEWVLALNVQGIINTLPTIPNNDVFANISGSTATPTGVTVSALIDSAISNVQGSILYRGASAWSSLAPGTNGYILQTGGASANPSWVVATSGGTITSVTAGTGLTGGGASGGVTLTIASIANNSLFANVSGGSAAPSATTISAFLDSALGNTQGSIIYRGASAWSLLAPGTNGQVLQTAGAGANPAWGTVSSGMTLLNTVNASAAASVIFGSTYLNATYSKYVIEFDGTYTPNSGGDSLYVQVSTNNGSTWVTSNYYTVIQGYDTTSGAISGSTITDVGLPITNRFNLTNNAGNPSSGTIKFSNCASAVTQTFWWQFNGNMFTGSFQTNWGGALKGNAAATFNAIKIFPGGGGTITGNFHLYGLSGT